jgi:E3 ubiquitin-protein ligase mind-bomb
LTFLKRLKFKDSLFFLLSNFVCFRILIDPRRKAKRLNFRGLYPGARVSRGPDWNYGEQDSGEKKTGKIIEIQDWSKTHPRSAAYVVWDNNRENLYRVGIDGMVRLVFNKKKNKYSCRFQGRFTCSNTRKGWILLS